MVRKSKPIRRLEKATRAINRTRDNSLAFYVDSRNSKGSGTWKHCPAKLDRSYRLRYLAFERWVKLSARFQSWMDRLRGQYGLHRDNRPPLTVPGLQLQEGCRAVRLHTQATGTSTTVTTFYKP